MLSLTAFAIECSIQSFPILDQSEEFHKAKQRLNKSYQKTSNRVIQPTFFDEDKQKHDCRTEHTHEEHATRKQLRRQRLDELEKKRLERPGKSHPLPEEVDDGLDDWKPPVETMKGWDAKHLLYKILLQFEFSCELKMKFNQKLLHLKHEKEDIVSFLIECKRRIREITEEIGYPYPEEYFSKLYIDFQNEKNGNTTYYKPYVMSQKKWFMNHSNIENLCGIDKEEFMRHHVLLRHEMNRLMLGAKERVSSFDTSIQQLKVEQDDLLVELHAQEIRLIALFQQLSIVIQTESKEKVLDDVCRKATEALDNVRRLEFEKQKEFHEIETKINTLKAKESKREKSLQTILSKCILHYRVLQDLYYNSDDEDHPFPPECPTKYYDSVSNLRRSRQAQEKKMQEFMNDLDAIHHDLNVLAEEKERSKIEAMISRENLDSFLEDKVAMLSKVKSTFVVRDGPICNTRMDSTKFMICSRSNLEVLKEKKKYVQTIISKEKSTLKSLQLQHNELKKQSNAIEERVKQLQQDCDYIQKLKLGQVLELDALYSFLDSIDGDEDSNTVNDSQNLEDDMKLEISHAEKRLEELKMKLKVAMRTNTSLLQQIGTLHEKQKFYMSEKEKNAKHNRIPQHVHDKEIKELKKIVDANSTKIQGLRSAIEQHQRKTNCTNDYHEVSTFAK